MSAPHCPECGGWLLKLSGKYGNYLQCENWPECDVRGACHLDTDVPLGVPANLRTRKLRMLVHGAFDALWQQSRLWAWSHGRFKAKQEARQQAYDWLSTQLNMELVECHIGRFDEPTCLRVLFLLQNVDGAVLAERWGSTDYWVTGAT